MDRYPQKFWLHNSYSLHRKFWPLSFRTLHRPNSKITRGAVFFNVFIGMRHYREFRLLTKPRTATWGLVFYSIKWSETSSGVTRIFTRGEGGGTTNMFTKAGIHHRNVYIKKYDKLAHLIAHKMAWSFQRQASVISIKTVNDTSRVNLLYNIPFNTTKQKFLESFLSAARSQFILNHC